MSKILNGGRHDIPPVNEETYGDIFENAIRTFGVVAACEWFGIRDEEFIKETVRVLQERSKEKPQQ